MVHTDLIPAPLPDSAERIAAIILAGFEEHYRIFRAVSAGAKNRFETANWAAVQDAHRMRIDLYDRRVRETVKELQRECPDTVGQESLWPRIKRAYITRLVGHLQPELAETFYNSVACAVLRRHYYRNEYIFWRPAVSTEHIEGREPTYRCYYPPKTGLRRAVLDMLRDFGLRNRFEDLRRNVRAVVAAFEDQLPQPWRPEPNFQLQVLRSLFFRNKAAYVVGRVVNGAREHAFVIPILQNEERELYLDALILEPDHIALVFSFAYAYCMVDMEVPSAYVHFLRSILPYKKPAELYTLIGLQKQGKTAFYRDLQHHLKHSTDRFTVAPGIRGMVMMVFTLPSFPFVFKLIRDHFAPPKDITREEVLAKYQVVKGHDRVGRMADMWEYSEVALPLDRFEPELVEELLRDTAETVHVEGESLVIRHVYIERRLVPLNLYLEKADPARAREAVDDYGRALHEMAAANIFPGDMLLKNFGLTRLGRVVFYDYDEICYLTECNFRRIPPPRHEEDEMAAEPWYTVGPHDIFPEEFPPFLFPSPALRTLFMELHPELADAAYWASVQQDILDRRQVDVFPYPQRVRFSRPDAPEGVAP